MEIMISVMLIIGLVLMGVAIYLIKKEQKEREELNVRIDEAFELVNSALDSFEVQTSDFNSTCEMIFKEIEEKYQELFVIYGLIEEQKMNNELNKPNEVTLEATQITPEIPTEHPINNIPKVATQIDDNKKKDFIYKNKNAEAIFKLYDEGFSVTEIAKKLSIGKGEVQLMLNIRKA